VRDRRFFSSDAFLSGQRFERRSCGGDRAATIVAHVACSRDVRGETLTDARQAVAWVDRGAGPKPERRKSSCYGWSMSEDGRPSEDDIRAHGWNHREGGRGSTHETRATDDDVVALGEAIAETAAVLDAVTQRFLSQLREFDQAGGWERAGALSCAHWLSWRIGMDLGAAREKIRVARRLAELPAIDSALADGTISYSKVRAMTRIANATNQGELLTMARNMTASQLERICRLARHVESLAGKDPRDVEDRQRYAASRRTDDGMVSIQIRLHADEAARFMKALEVASDGGNLADGAVALAESVLAAGGARPAGSGPDAGAVRDPGPRADCTDRVRSPVEVVVHISAETLTGETELGDAISAEVTRRLLCDAGIVPMLEDGRGRTIDVGRKSRAVPSALQRALRRRDRGCRFPGCTNSRFVDAHHIRHWVDGGETNLDNTFLVCRRHHRFLHEYVYQVETVGDELVFRDPDGRILPPQGERPACKVDALGWLRDGAGDGGAAISPETNAPGWDGQRIDLDLCIAALDLAH
jgi:hypothetical protein